MGFRHESFGSGAVRRAMALAAALCWCWSGCGATLSPAEATQLRHRLREAMQADVSTRAQRDDQSRLLADVVHKGALDHLSQEDVRAALGAGQACRNELCEKHGFSDTDWYYEIGRAQSDQVKQLPVLIVGFDPQGRAVRVWTLTTH